MKFMGKTLKKREHKKSKDIVPRFSVIRKVCPIFSEFGKEAHRSYPVHEYCYDCKKFIKGCNGWNPRKKFECRKVKWCKKIKAG